MKSFQNWSGTSSSSSGGSQPHRPLFEDLGGEGAGEGLLEDETDRWPRFRSASPMPTQSWSGLKPSGKRRLSPGRPYSPSLPSTASACRAAREVAVRSTCDREDAEHPAVFKLVDLPSMSGVSVGAYIVQKPALFPADRLSWRPSTILGLAVFQVGALSNMPPRRTTVEHVASDPC